MTILGLKRIPRHLEMIELSLWSAVAAGLVLRLWLAWQPITTLVGRYNADDAYYYFTIARHIAQGHGATFDGLAPTNGFHPLYLLLLVPIYWLSPGNTDLNVHLSLSLAVLFNVLTALPLYWTLRRIASDRAALLSVVAWLFGPGVIAIVLEGVESGVYVFFVALSAFLYVEYQTQPIDSSRQNRAAWLGVALGLTILARSDGIMLLAAVLLDMFIRRVSWRAMAVTIATCGLVLLPWVVWNLITFGSVMQASGSAILYSTTQEPLTAGQIVGSSGVFLASSIVLAFPCVVVVLFMAITFVDFRFRRGFRHRLGRSTGIHYLRFIFLYILMLFAFYAWVFRFRQNWYLLPPVFAITLITGWLFDLFIAWLNRRSPLLTTNLTGLAIGIVLTTFLLVAYMWESNRMAMHPLQAGGYRIAQWLAAETDPEIRVGSWNSGIIGYFSQRSIVNLDGVVNNELYKHVASRRASFDLAGEWDYIQAVHITLVTDYEDIMTPLLNGKLKDRLVVAHEMPGMNNQPPILILAVQP